MKLNIWKSKEKKQDENKSNNKNLPHKKSQINLESTKEISESSIEQKYTTFLSTSNIDYQNFGIRVAIVKDTESKGLLKYILIEPTMTKKNHRDYEELRRILMTELTVDLKEIKSKQDAARKLRQQIIFIVKKYDLKIPPKILSYDHAVMVLSFLSE